MDTEFEIKFLANHDVIRAKLMALQAVCLRKRGLMRRYVFALSAVDGRDRWIRVRDEGEYVSLTLKSFDDSKGIDSVEELELHVSDFDTMVVMLQLMGYLVATYVENYREIWQLRDALIMLDEWPWLDPLVEIEGASKVAVFDAAALLGISEQDFLYGPNRLLYEKKYGISQDVMKQNKTLTFQKRPVWVK